MLATHTARRVTLPTRPVRAMVPSRRVDASVPAQRRFGRRRPSPPAPSRPFASPSACCPLRPSWSTRSASLPAPTNLSSLGMPPAPRGCSHRNPRHRHLEPGLGGGTLGRRRPLPVPTRPSPLQPAHMSPTPTQQELAAATRGGIPEGAFRWLTKVVAGNFPKGILGAHRLDRDPGPTTSVGADWFEGPDGAIVNTTTETDASRSSQTTAPGGQRRRLPGRRRPVINAEKPRSRARTATTSQTPTVPEGRCWFGCVRAASRAPLRRGEVAGVVSAPAWWP